MKQLPANYHDRFVIHRDEGVFLNEQEMQQRALYEDLRRWRSRALDDVKAGRSFRTFVSPCIPQELSTVIDEELQRCTQANEVRTLFERYNQNHDKHGRFAAGSGGASSSSGSSGGGGSSGGKGKSKAAQLRALERDMAAKHPDTHFDFTGADPAMMEGVCKQLDTLMNTYPEVGKSLAYVGTGKNAPQGYGAEHLAGVGHFACCASRTTGSTAYSSMVLNKDYFGDPALMAEKMQNLSGAGWFAKGAAAGGAEYLVTHEFGHAVDAYLATVGKNQTVGKVFDVATETYMFKGNSSRMGSTVSGYARQGGPIEQWAEAFASLHYAPPAQQAPYTKRLGALLSKVLPNGSSASWHVRI